MAVPQKRNQKKTRGRSRQPYASQSRRFTLDRYLVSLEEQPTFEEWLDEIEYPGDWLEEYANMPTFGERLLSMRRGSILDRHSNDDDYDQDIGNDFDDLYEE
jgi:hypothetical protein